MVEQYRDLKSSADSPFKSSLDSDQEEELDPALEQAISAVSNYRREDAKQRKKLRKERDNVKGRKH